MGKEKRLKLEISKDILKKLYIDNDYSTRKIAEKLNYTQPNIRYWLKKHDIVKKDKEIKCLVCSKIIKTISPIKKCCSKKCTTTYQNRKAKQKNNCIDCGAHIEKRSNRCKKCHYEFYIGKNNYNWNNGEKKNNGYIYVNFPEHPNANSNGYIAKHRLILEKQLGRYLNKNEIAHHIDKNKLNNNPTNIELYTHKKHSSFHNKMMIANCNHIKVFDSKLNKYRCTKCGSFIRGKI